MPAGQETRVEAIARQIAAEILEGALPAGVRLPSVRAQAQAHDVNVSTIQRVLARLSELGLVEAHDRRGIEVRDVSRTAGSALWRLRLERAPDDPGPAVALVRDAFSIRRALAVEVLADLASRDWRTYGDELRGAIEAFVRIATAEPAADPSRLLDAESEILRTVLLAVERPAVLAIVNDVNAMIAATPALLAAIYRDPELSARTWETLGAMLGGGDATSETLAGVHAILADFDQQMIADFARRIGA